MNSFDQVVIVLIALTVTVVLVIVMKRAVKSTFQFGGDLFQSIAYLVLVLFMPTLVGFLVFLEAKETAWEVIRGKDHNGSSILLMFLILFIATIGSSGILCIAWMLQQAMKYFFDNK